MRDIYHELCQILGSDSVKTEEEMKNHTTFRVGGPASYYVSPENKDQLAEIVKLCHGSEMPYYILGNGSNVLVGDGGYEGVIISMTEGFGFCQIQKDTGLLTAGSGILLAKAAKKALEESLTGMEFAAGIPGTAGGAVVMNAGAYGFEMKDILSGAEVLTEDGNRKRLSREELELGYRTSCIIKNKYIVLEAYFQLEQGDRETIGSRMKELSQARRSKQPLEYPSAGSTFKRPEGYFAGKLIDEAGLRGYQYGGAQVSEKHCGFVINKQEATAADIMALCSIIKEKVKETSGVEIEMEVKSIGKF